jgi:protein TonB
MPTPGRQIKPRYPMSARRMGQSGQVLLRLFVDQEGAVREVNVVRAEPAGVFDEAAVEAARKWHFSPAMSRGVPVGMWMTLPVRFSLEDR